MKKWILILTTIAFITSCKKSAEEDSSDSTTDASSNIIESAVSESNSQANAIVTARASLEPQEFLSLEESIQAIADMQNSQRTTCSIASARSSCSSSAITLTWNCTIGSSSVQYTGVINETFSGFGAAVCQLNGNGSTLTRVISNSNPRKLTFSTGATITSHMNPETAWDGTTFPSASTGTTIARAESGTVGGFSCSAGNACYTTTINGLQNTGKTSTGREFFDHLISGTIYSQGSKSNSNLVFSGSLSIWHQLAQYKAVNTFNSLTWGDSSCCYPTSGSISSTLTGSISGSWTTTFSSTCGQATFVNESSTSRTITLNNCSL